MEVGRSKRLLSRTWDPAQTGWGHAPARDQSRGPNTPIEQGHKCRHAGGNQGLAHPAGRSHFLRGRESAERIAPLQLAISLAAPT